MNWIKITREKLSARSRIPPFLLALGGVVSDYVTTTIGLGMGFYETHPQYHPFWAILYFWGVITILTVALPKKRLWTLCINGLASASYLGFVNNALVILGIFPGIHI